jgi:hypothetical protein
MSSVKRMVGCISLFYAMSKTVISRGILAKKQLYDHMS